MTHRSFNLVLEAPEEADFRSAGACPKFKGEEHPTEKGWFWTGAWDRLGFPVYAPRPAGARVRGARLQDACRKAALWLVMSPVVLMFALFVYTVVVSLARGYPRG